MSADPVKVTVEHCNDCPFAHEVELDEFLCTAKEGADGHFRTIRRAFLRGSKPPRWCPLRSAPRLVVIG